MKRKINTKMIIYAAFLLTIALLLGGGIKQMTGIPVSLSVNIGTAKHTVDFTGIPLALSGLIIGPIGALIVGISYDNIGFLLFQSGAIYNPLFTIADTLAALLPAFYFKYLLKRKRNKNISFQIILFLVLYTMVAILTSSVLSGGSKTQQQFAIFTYQNGVFKIVNLWLLLIILIIMIISITLFIYLNNHKKTSYIVSSNQDFLTFDKVYMISILTVLPRTLVSGIASYFHYLLILNTPIPLVYFLIQRLISAIILIPITAIVLFSLKQIIRRNTLLK